MPDSDHPQIQRLAPKPLSIALAFLSAVLFFTSCEVAPGSSQSASEEIRSLREQIASVRADIEKIQTSSIQARVIEAWVSASLPIQPLIVAITRSVSAPGKLKELRLAREADSPGRVTISLELSDAPKSQMESTLTAIHSVGFREQSVTLTDSDGAIKFDAILVWEGSNSGGTRFYPGGQTNGTSPAAGSSVQVSAAPSIPTSPNADDDAPSLRAALRSLQDYARALADQTADTLAFARAWQPYFALTDEANLAEKGISMKLRMSELAVPRSSFKIVDCSPLYPRWSEVIPQVLQGEVVIEDNFAKGINWLGMMERVKPTTRICSVSIASAGKDKCRFDLVFEVPLVKKLPN